ncbi:MAG: type VI secretion system tip protein VgrG [Deltaproteobacteria bacterium]|nr:type VI secretion system tip protein VgrG [Deltaproteobacteria bacterium]
MERTKLTFDGGESSLSIRSFRVRERISEPFQIDIVARTENADLNFEALIGQPARFELRNDAPGALVAARTWTGLCARCEQLRAESDGLSTYALTIVPRLWLLAQRRNYRLFQHLSVIDIAASMAAEWKVSQRLLVARTHYPPLELRIQYGESDYDFLCRLLEEAGICFTFTESDDAGTVMVLSDEPHAAEKRAAELQFVDEEGPAQAAGKEYCTNLRVRRELRPGKVVLRDFDFRRPAYELFAQASTEEGPEEALEQYHYVPGAFKTEGHPLTDTPAADDLGVARADELAGKGIAQRRLEGERVRRRAVAFETNAFDLCPGTTLAVTSHPRAEINDADKLLMVSLEISGEEASDEPWVAEGQALFTDGPYRPELRTAKPRIFGIQSAVVVGPEKETVFTDEYGRVRVQFHWDRQGVLDPMSSCWMRVSQAWAGPGYGLINLPRVGHEVLVGFVEGDPDQPIIVGRVFNGAQQVPYPLPGSKMMSGWKSDSNSNIILFDDTPGDEVFYTQAERNKLNIVKRHEATIIGGHRTEYLGTFDKLMSNTSTERVAIGTNSQVAGISNTLVSAISFKAQAGFGATIKAGKKFEAGVVPVVPFITALMDVNDAKAQILNKLPGGKAPDLKQMVPKYAGGPQPTPPPTPNSPSMTQEETELKLKKTLAVVGNAVAKFEPEEVEEMAESEDLDHAVTHMLGTLEKRGGEEAVQAMVDAQQLSAELKTLSDASMKPQPKQQPLPKQQQQVNKQSSMFERLLLSIVEMILPKTKITIEHQKIKLQTEKASIELNKGDITIKAEGKIKLEGGSVSISPDNCKCA